MKSTKNKILKESLNLFNTNGITNTSLRMIAGKLDISLGNLNYHFKKRNDIILYLYSEFSDEIDRKFIEIMIKEKINIDEALFFIKELMGSFFDNRYFFLDFSYIIRAYPTIRKSYKNMLEQREQQFPLLFSYLIQSGVLVEEMYRDQYIFLYKRLQIISDFWIPYSVINNQKKRKEVINGYLKMVLSEIYPYFSDKLKPQINTFLAHKNNLG
jgi:AcrR family transcriptional regulator